MDEATLRFEGFADSALLSGKVSIGITEDALVCDALFAGQAVAYADIDRITFTDYTLCLTAGRETLRLSRLGQSGQWLFEKLSAAYHACVLKALLVEQAPLFTANGRCETLGGAVELRLFPDSLCLLPPNGGARRLPLCFFNDLRQENYALCLRLTSGERYCISGIGYDLAPLCGAIGQALRTQRSATAAFLTKLVPMLSKSEAAQFAVRFAEGIAVPLSALPASLAGALEQKAQNSKMDYRRLKQLGNSETMAIGICALPEELVDELAAALLEQKNENAETPAEALGEKELDALRWRVFAVLAAPDGQSVIAEFAFPDEDAATYVFRTGGDTAAFLPVLNRALEANHLGRELFSLPEEALRSPQKAKQRMLLQRTPALQTLRRAFVGKAIHRSAESWESSVRKLLAAAPAPSVPPQRP